MKERKQVTHAPINIGNNLHLLIQEENKNNFNSKGYVLNKYYCKKKEIKYIGKPNNKGILKNFKLISKLKVFLKIKKNTDIYFLHFGGSILDFPILNLNFLDYKFMRKKKTICYFRGTDIRRSKKSYKNSILFKIYDFLGLREKRLKKLLSICNIVFYSTPDLYEEIVFLKTKKMNFKLIHLPVFLDLDNKIKKNSTNKKIKILHTPTDYSAKGTKEIRTAIKKLKKEHFNFEYIEKTKLSPQKIEQEYANCDVFIDQLKIGWYGASAVKALKYNKIVLCNINKKYVKYSTIKKIPITNINEKNLYQKLKKILENKEKYQPTNKEIKEFLYYHNYKNLYELAIKYYEK